MPWRKLPWKLGTLASASRIGAFFDPGEPRPHIYQNFPFSTYSYPARQAPIGFILKLFLAPGQRAGRQGAGQLLFIPNGAASLQAISIATPLGLLVFRDADPRVARPAQARAWGRNP